MERFAVDTLYPQWKVFDEVPIDVTFKAMQVDSLRDTHPLTFKVDGLRQIEAVFDSISYEKGKCLRSMLCFQSGYDVKLFQSSSKQTKSS